MRVDGVRLWEIRTRQQFLAALKRHRWLRAFVDVDNDTIIAWDGDTLVHPDVRQATGDFGIPVQMNSVSIFLRPHGMEVVYVKQMYRDLIASPVVRRVYGGNLPTIHVDDEYDEIGLDRVDNLGWETKDDSDLDAEGNWRDMWVSY